MRNGYWVGILVGFAATVATLFAVFWEPQPHVVLYCAQDEPFARDLLAAFSKTTGLAVFPKFDTEANKSVGLYQDVVDEARRPRCDVFWNNELFGMIRLEEKGLLADCPSPFGPDETPIPPQAVSRAGKWVALGTRCRVLLVNTALLKPEQYPTSLLDLADGRYAGKVAMAKPTHGMSATQAACLFEVLGVEAAKKYYRDLKANSIQIAPGNKQAAEWVAAGVSPTGQAVAVAVTDTDDALAEVRAGKPVKLIFPDGDSEPRAARMGTIFVPNAVGIVQGGPNSEGAKRLVEYLLSEKTETALATGESAQIPVRKALRSKLPIEMHGVADLRPMGVDFYRAAGLWDEVQTFLRNEFAR